MRNRLDVLIGTVEEGSRTPAPAAHSFGPSSMRSSAADAAFVSTRRSSADCSAARGYGSGAAHADVAATAASSPARTFLDLDLTPEDAMKGGCLGQ
jgi:hypothetical protein